jgi:hypothetical protein
VRCPFCGRVLFMSRLAWVPCDDAAAVVSVRCPTRPAWKCGEIIYLRLLSVPSTRFDDAGTREATVKVLRSAVET